MRSFPFQLTSLTVLFFLFAQVAQAQSDGSISNVSFDDVLTLPVSDPNAILEYGENQFQYGKLWIPDTAQQSAPLVVVIHGGCWLNSFDVNHTDALNHALMNDGFAVWAFEYRRTGDVGGGWPGTYEDVLDAILYTENFATHGINTDKMAIIGHSAGGHLALLAGTEFENAELIVSLAGIADIEKYAEGNSSCEQAAVQFIGARPAEDPQSYAAANPKGKTLHNNSVLMHGELDIIVPLSQIDGLSVNKIIVPGAGHFDWIHSQTTAYAILVQQLKQALR